MNRVLGRDILIGFLFLVIQLIIFRHLSLLGATADLILLFILWLSSNQPSRVYALLFAAALGFIQDAFLDIWGMNMFAKVLVSLVSFNYLQRMMENKAFISQIALSIFICSFIHNLVFLGIGALATDYNIGINFWQLSVGNSIYTAISGTLIYLFKKDD